MSMNFNKKSTLTPKKNNTKTIIFTIVLAIIILAITITAIHLGNSMNDLAFQTSNVKEPVSVLGASINN